MIIAEALVALLILAGAFFALVGSLGIVRLRDLFQRLHAPTKATTLGVGCTVLASSMFFTLNEPGVSLRELLILAFLFITAPVSAHTQARAAIRLGVQPVARTRGRPWKYD